MSCLVVSPIHHYRHRKIEFMKMKNFRRKLERESEIFIEHFIGKKLLADDGH